MPSRPFVPQTPSSTNEDAMRSSCHEPRVNFVIRGINGGRALSEDGNPRYEHFLATPNEGSALCLGCYDK